MALGPPLRRTGRAIAHAPDHQRRPILDPGDDRTDIVDGGADLEADEVLGLVHQPHGDIALGLVAQIIEQTRAARPPQPLGQFHVIGEDALGIAHARQRHHQIDIWRKFERRLPLYQPLRILDRVGGNPGHQQPLATHLFTGKTHQLHLIISSDMMDETGSGNANYPAPITIQMIVFHQIADVLSMRSIIDLGLAKGDDRYGCHGVQRVE